MGRTKTGAYYSTDWTPPEYTVDKNGKVVGGYQPTGPNNWGRWGSEDERGTANTIGTEQVVRAAQLVKSGRVYSLALPIEASAPRWPTRPAPLHVFTATGADSVVGNPMYEGFVQAGLMFNDDLLFLATQGSTQWDALSHVMVKDVMYNGFWGGDVTSNGGARVLGIGKLHESFVGRGVLIDVARHLGVDSLPRKFPINRQLLEEVTAAQKVTVEPGDMVLLRTGYISVWPSLKTPEEQMEYFLTAPSLSPDGMVDWVHEHDIAAIAIDTLGLDYVAGTPEPFFHQSALVDLGLHLGELFYLEDLSAACAEDGGYAFLLVAPPLYLPRAVGTPLNPIAIK
jgi:kynurenine formamidase